MPTLFALPFPAVLDPIALEIGPLAIRWYALAYIAAFILGWQWARRLAEQAGGRPKPDDIDDFMTWAILGVILGGRLGYVLLYRPEILANPLEILALWQGGMAFHGGAAGVILAIFLYAWRHRIDPLRLGDIICAAVPIGLFLGRLANFVNNELWGRPTDLPWAVIFPIPDQLEASLPEVGRHPSQLYEAALEGVLLFVVLNLVFRRALWRRRPGLVSGLFLAGYGVVRSLVEFTREPDLGLDPILGLSHGQLYSLPMILGGLILVGLALKRGVRAP